MAEPIKKSVTIKAPAEQVWLILEDMEQYSELMDDVESVKVTSRIGNQTITEWETSVDGTPILWTERDTFLQDQLCITYELIEGDLDKFEGYWQVTRIDDAECKVELFVDYDFGIPELTNLIGPTLEQKVGENSDMMLAGIKKKAEESAMAA